MESTLPLRMFILVQDRIQDPLFHIVPFPLPAPVLVTFPYRVNTPLVLVPFLVPCERFSVIDLSYKPFFPVPIPFPVPLPVPVPFKFCLNKSLLHLSLNVLFHSIHFVFFIVRIIDTEAQVCRSDTLGNLS